MVPHLYPSLQAGSTRGAFDLLLQDAMWPIHHGVGDGSDYERMSLRFGTDDGNSALVVCDDLLSLGGDLFSSVSLWASMFSPTRRCAVLTLIFALGGLVLRALRLAPHISRIWSSVGEVEILSWHTEKPRFYAFSASGVVSW